MTAREITENINSENIFFPHQIDNNVRHAQAKPGLIGVFTGSYTRGGGAFVCWLLADGPSWPIESEIRSHTAIDRPFLFT